MHLLLFATIIVYQYSHWFSRSAAHASLKQYNEAVQDADKTISLKSDWPKGYSRKGAALHGLGDLEAASKAYEEGLKVDPSNSLLKKGLDDVEKYDLAYYALTIQGNVWFSTVFYRKHVWARYVGETSR